MVGTLHLRLAFLVSASLLVPSNSMICPRGAPKRHRKPQNMRSLAAQNPRPCFVPPEAIDCAAVLLCPGALNPGHQPAPVDRSDTREAALHIQSGPLPRREEWAPKQVPIPNCATTRHLPPPLRSKRGPSHGPTGVSDVRQSSYRLQGSAKAVGGAVTGGWKNVVEAGVGVWECLGGRVKAGVLGVRGYPSSLQAIPCRSLNLLGLRQALQADSLTGRGCCRGSHATRSPNWKRHHPCSPCPTGKGLQSATQICPPPPSPEQRFSSCPPPSPPHPS